MAPTLLLAGARALHYAAVIALFGTTLFPSYALFAGRRDAPLERLLLRTVRVTAAAAVLSAVPWFALVASETTRTPSGGVDLADLWPAILGSSFGRVWLGRIALALVILWAALHEHRRLNATLPAVLLTSIALTGHTRLEEGISGVLHIAVDAAHLLAAGVWMGALIPMLALARFEPAAARARGLDVGVAMTSYSAVGVVAVAVLVITGLGQSWMLVGSPDRLSTAYGQVLMLKLALFAAMLGIAGVNRVWLMAALNAGLAPDQTRPWLRRLSLHLMAEQAIGVLLLVTVGFLGVLEPAYLVIG